MNNTIKFSIDSKNSGKRLDVFLTENMSQFTRSFLKKLIDKRQVKVNKSVISSPSKKVKCNDEIIVKIIEEEKKIYSSKEN